MKQKFPSLIVLGEAKLEAHLSIIYQNIPIFVTGPQIRSQVSVFKHTDGQRLVMGLFTLHNVRSQTPNDSTRNSLFYTLSLVTLHFKTQDVCLYLVVYVAVYYMIIDMSFK